MNRLRFKYDCILEKLFLLYFCVMFCHQSVPGLKGILLAMIVALTVAKFLKKRCLPRRIPYVVVWYLSVFVLAYVSQYWGISHHSNVHTILSTMLRIFIIIICMALYATTKEKAEKLFRVYYLSCIYFSLILLITSPLSTYGTSDFSGITGQWKTFIGQIMVFSIILALYYIQKGYTGSKYCIILFSVTILATGSVKGLSGIFFVVLLYILLFHKLKKKLKFFAIIAMIAIVSWNIIMTVPFFYDIFGIRIEHMLNDSGQDASALERSYFVEYGLEISSEHSVLGHGIDGFAESLRRKGYSNPTYSHNNWIEILVCYGRVGILIYYFGYMYCIWQCIKKRKNSMSKIIIIIMITFMVYEIWFVSHYMYMYVFLISIAMLNIRQVDKIDIDSRRHIDVRKD